MGEGGFYPNNHKKLDPSYKLDLDVLDYFGREKLIDINLWDHHREVKSQLYSQINMETFSYIFRSIFQKKVKKPRVTKYFHDLVTTGTTAGQKVITLILDIPQDSPLEGSVTPKASPSKTVAQSKSSPQLQGVWNDRFIPVPTPEKKGSVNNCCILTYM